MRSTSQFSKQLAGANNCFLLGRLALAIGLLIGWSSVVHGQSAASLDGHALPKTAEGAQRERLHRQSTATAGQKQDDPHQLRKMIRKLEAEIQDLLGKVADLEKIAEINSLNERLTNEEQRAYNLQMQLVGIAEKASGLQMRLDEINEQLRSDNIEQLPISGSLHPEQIREATLRRLTNEKQGIQSQLDLLQQTRTRVQASLFVNDLMIQRLRQQLQTTLRP
jgi:hypothetical protein